MKGLVLKNSLQLIYVSCHSLVSQSPEIRMEHSDFVRCISEPSVGMVSERLGICSSRMEMYLENSVSQRDAQWAKYKRFLISLLLHEVAEERSSAEVAERFKISRGSIQMLQASGASSARMISILCEKLGWRPLAMLFALVSERLSFGVQGDLMNLMQIPDVPSFRARALFVSGIKNIETLADSSEEEVIAAIRKGVAYSDPSKLKSVGCQDQLTATNLIKQAKAILESKSFS
jgi:replicative superfamily II helicase